MFENPRRGRQARNFTTNSPKILDLKSSSEQIFSRKLPLGGPVKWRRRRRRCPDREFKISRRRRRQKHRLKSDSSIYETLARFSQLGHYVLCKRTLPELNS